MNVGCGPEEKRVLDLEDRHGRGTQRPSSRRRGAAYTLEPYDTLYVPRDSDIEVSPAGDLCDLAEIAAPVSKQHPVQLVRFSEVQQDAGLHFEAGGPGAKRELNVLLGKNVEAGRIMAGVTFSQPGNGITWSCSLGSLDPRRSRAPHQTSNRTRNADDSLGDDRVR